MIKKISFENLLTFDKRQVIEFNLKEQINVIYGKNASGKTNFLTVLSVLQKSITTGLVNADHLVCKYTSSDCIYIEVLLEVQDDEFNYGFIYDTKKAKYISEILLVNDELILENNNGELKSKVLKVEQIHILNNYDFTNNGVMKYITELNTENEFIKKIKKLKNYFEYEDGLECAYKCLVKNERLMNVIIKEMKSIDADIENIIIRNNTNAMIDLEKEIRQAGIIDENIITQIVSQQKYKVYFIYQNIDHPLEMQSNGIQKYFEMIVSTLVKNEKYGEYIYIFDEIEMHFHDELMKQFFKFFKSQIRGQLICTTHNQKILDEKLVSNQNIMFVDKSQNSSEIYRLSSFYGVKNDSCHNWKKLYNEGRFGAF